MKNQGSVFLLINSCSTYFHLKTPNKHHENIKKKQFINLKNPLKILKIQNQPGKKNSLDPNLPFQFRYRFKNTLTGPLIE